MYTTIKFEYLFNYNKIVYQKPLIRENSLKYMFKSLCIYLLKSRYFANKLLQNNFFIQIPSQNFFIKPDSYISFGAFSIL